MWAINYLVVKILVGQTKNVDGPNKNVSRQLKMLEGQTKKVGGEKKNIGSTIKIWIKKILCRNENKSNILYCPQVLKKH